MAIIFDFDGVIVDSLQTHLRAYRAVFGRFGKDLPFDTVEKWRDLYNSEWERNFLENGFSPEEMGQALNVYGDLLDYSDAPVYGGMRELLSELSKTHALAVASTTDDAIIRAKLKDENLEPFFKAVFGKGERSDKTEKLRQAIAALGASPAETCYVGDTASDIRAGRALGVRTIAMTGGWYSAQRLEAEGPWAMAANAAELRAIILRGA